MTGKIDRVEVITSVQRAGAGRRRSRQAIVYLRQFSAAQVEHNRESTERQYALASKARDLGWPDRAGRGHR